LALQYRNNAAIVAVNISSRTGHPIEVLEQIAMLGVIKPDRRYSPERGAFRPYARTCANGQWVHYLRAKDLLIKLPPNWRELYAVGQKLISLGTEVAEMPERLGLRSEWWRAIVVACRQRVVTMDASGVW
jgi:DNA-directed RNA polymerase specialized sigma subunit